MGAPSKAAHHQAPALTTVNASVASMAKTEIRRWLSEPTSDTGTGFQIMHASSDINEPASLTEAYWARPVADLLRALGSDCHGLHAPDAGSRLERFGRNRLSGKGQTPGWKVFLRQFRSSLVLILIFAAITSAVVGEMHEAIIIGIIILASCGLSFLQEFAATRAMDALRQSISSRTTVIRDGAECVIPTEEIVPGDVMRLTAGTLIAADGLIISANEFNVSEAVLTGETFPVLKSPGLSETDAPLTRRSNAVFCGTSVRSGTADALVVRTGRTTEFAAIAAAIERDYPETEFARGIRRFGYLMTEVMLVIVIVVFCVNLFLHRPLIDSLLFSLALAVGLAPELLPAIISITLASGARRMAKSGVVVRRLEAIENLGSMDTLCTDKTGTLTEGVVRLDSVLDANGNPSDDVLHWAGLNAGLQTGIPNPLDEAVVKAVGDQAAAGFVKIAEIPYDFVRKRLSVAVRHEGEPQDLLICKGAVQSILDVCATVRSGASALPLDAARLAAIDTRFRDWSAKGFRVLALAVRRFDRNERYDRDDEKDLCLAGFLLFFDPPKAGVSEVIDALHRRGVRIKMISGDNRHVAAHVAEAIGLETTRIMTGAELSKMTKSALFGAAPDTDIFAEIDPNQKERIIEALRRRGHVVGYLGDGINDAPALHEADIGISVDSAVDVAREAADIVLLKRDLGVLMRGIDDGRRTFANTMKYIAMTTSANFGNMISMAFASMFLPFLPLLAKQILLNNLISDIPSLAIASDNVDAADIRKPRRWDIHYVRRFMVTFGLLSSAFDFVTFGFLLYIAHTGETLFQTGWFVESLMTQLSNVLVIRTTAAFWKSRPSPILLTLTLAMGAIAILMPYLPFADWFGFKPLPLSVLAVLLAITGIYLVACEGAKSLVFRQRRRRR
jgi:Mg2+-importing ATPase